MAPTNSRNRRSTWIAAVVLVQARSRIVGPGCSTCTGTAGFSTASACRVLSAAHGVRKSPAVVNVSRVDPVSLVNCAAIASSLSGTAHHVRTSYHRLPDGFSSRRHSSRKDPINISSHHHHHHRQVCCAIETSEAPNCRQDAGCKVQSDGGCWHPISGRFCHSCTQPTRLPSLHGFRSYIGGPIQPSSSPPH